MEAPPIDNALKIIEQFINQLRLNSNTSIVSEFKKKTAFIYYKCFHSIISIFFLLIYRLSIVSSLIINQILMLVLVHQLHRLWVARIIIPRVLLLSCVTVKKKTNQMNQVKLHQIKRNEEIIKFNLVLKQMQ